MRTKVPWALIAVVGVSVLLGIVALGFVVQRGAQQRRQTDLAKYEKRYAELQARYRAYVKQQREIDSGAVIPPDKKEAGLTNQEHAEAEELLRRIAALKVDSMNSP